MRGHQGRSRAVMPLTSNRTLARALPVAAVVLVCAGCGSEGFHSSSGTPTLSVTQTESELTASGVQATPFELGLDRSVGRSQRASSKDMTPGLRLAFTQAVQREAGPEYAFEASANGYAKAMNPTHGLQVRVGSNVRIMSASSGDETTTSVAPQWSFELSFKRFRRGETSEPAPKVSRPTQRNDNRASISRGSSIEEWYSNGPLGLEQGFELAVRPMAEKEGELVLELGVGGDLQPQLSTENAVVLSMLSHPCDLSLLSGGRSQNSAPRPIERYREGWLGRQRTRS